MLQGVTGAAPAGSKQVRKVTAKTARGATKAIKRKYRRPKPRTNAPDCACRTLRGAIQLTQQQTPLFDWIGRLPDGGPEFAMKLTYEITGNMKCETVLATSDPRTMPVGGRFCAIYTA